jgi:hypothetical protein
MRGITGFGERTDYMINDSKTCGGKINRSKINGRGFFVACESRCSHANFNHSHSRNGGEGLAHPAHARSAVHTIDFQDKFQTWLSR